MKVCPKVNMLFVWQPFIRITNTTSYNSWIILITPITYFIILFTSILTHAHGVERGYSRWFCPSVCMYIFPHDV